MGSIWSQDSKNEFFQAQSGLRIMSQVFCWIQFAVKGALGYYLFLNFKSKYPHEVNYLFNLNYTPSVSGNKEDSNVNADGSKAEEFTNPYK